MKIYSYWHMKNPKYECLMQQLRYRMEHHFPYQSARFPSWYSFWFQLRAPWEASGDGLSTWVPASYVGKLDWIPGSWFWLASLICGRYLVGNEPIDEKVFIHTAFQRSKWKEKWKYMEKRIISVHLSGPGAPSSPIPEHVYAISHTV